MVHIELRPVKLTQELMASLEKRGLVRALKPTAKALNTRSKTGAVSVLYRADARYGGHQLICIGKRATAVRLQVHPDNEDVLVLNPTPRRYKPLYLVLAFPRRALFERKLKAAKLNVKDFVAVELVYNDPALSAFTVLKNTVHTEVTTEGAGMHPVFFVAEPARLPTVKYALPGYSIELKGRT